MNNNRDMDIDDNRDIIRVLKDNNRDIIRDNNRDIIRDIINTVITRLD